MAEKLPQIQLPGGFPAWLISGHTGTDDDVYTATEMTAGHSRMRRVFSTAPQTRKVSMYLTQTQGNEFFNWFENDLQGGTLRFAAKVRKLGKGTLWYPAVFRSSPPYTATVMHRGVPEINWMIDAELTLYGDGSEYGPPLVSFEAGIRVPLIATAKARPGFANFSAAITVPLIGGAGNPLLSAAIAVPLGSSVAPSDQIPMYANIAVPLESSAAATRTTFFSANIQVELNGSVS